MWFYFPHGHVSITVWQETDGTVKSVTDVCLTMGPCTKLWGWLRKTCKKVMVESPGLGTTRKPLVPPRAEETGRGQLFELDKIPLIVERYSGKQVNLGE